MAQVLHGSGRTTQVVRRTIQRSQENLQTLANRHGPDPKTIARWRKRFTRQDARMSPEPDPERNHRAALPLPNHGRVNEHLQTFLLACNHAKRLKTLRGLTPHEFVCTQWQKDPVIFARKQAHLTLGIST